ncbi:NmrA-like family domain-containing oxidoreductase himF [Metarhizium brunneum]|uniref:NmrA-like family domain-containing oxidoreductase himF n=1 Tax=Metarhizium brunneum TaxID=500148 RepID=A0A7D5UVI7_9HYPO
MTPTKLVTVYGATGQQGSSVINSLLENKSGEFAIRAITRNRDSDKSRAFISRSVEVVNGDGFSQDQMNNAFKGSWAAFVNTNSSDPLLNRPGGMAERDLGKIIVDGAFEAGVQHFVYSGLVSASLATNGQVPSSSFDEKHAIGEYAKSKGFKSVVIVSAGWYMENHTLPEFVELMGGFPFTADADGYLSLRLPRIGGDDKLPFIAMKDDYGDLVHGVLLQPETYNGQLIQAASEMAKPDELVAKFQRMTGKKSRYLAIEDWRTIETYGSPDIEGLKTMYAFCQYVDGKYYGVPSSLEQAKELKAKAIVAKGLPREEYPLLNLEEFIKKYLII